MPSVSHAAPAPRMPRFAFALSRAFAAACLSIALALLFPAISAADALDGTLEVRSAYVSVGQGVFQLHARVAYPANEEIERQLKDGVTLTFELDVNVARPRRFWFDSDVANLQLRRELSYHTVTERYVVRELRNGEQQSFPGLEAALEYLGTVDDWPILVEPQLNNTSEYRVSVRAGIRRGRLTDALRVLMFWTDDWHRTSEWYSWSLPQ